jgi:TonB family protein
MAFAQADAPVETTTRSTTPALTLTTALLLILAAVLFGWYRYGQMRSDLATPADTSIVVTPTSAATHTAASTAVRNTAARTERRDMVARATRGSSSAQPLAGNPLPAYPAEALRSGEGGTVVLQVKIDQNGQPVDVDVARRSGSRDLDRAALAAVRDWRFKPATRNGKPVASVTELPVEFKPEG